MVIIHMNVTDQLSRLKVKEIFTDSAKRPFLFVYPDTKLLEVTTFLAIGPEIYVDGIVVITEENHNERKLQTPVGTIGGKSILHSVLEGTFDGQEVFFGDLTASEIMMKMTQSDWVELESPLTKAIEIFERTRFALVPVMSAIGDNANKLSMIGTLTVRDFLPLIINKKIHFNHDENEEIIRQISSPLMSVNKDISIKDAVSIMVNKGIRNIGIRNCDQDYENEHKEKGEAKEKSSTVSCIVNDRKIMEFLLSHNRRAMSNPILSSVSSLDITQTHVTRNNITIMEAAQYLMDIKNQFLVLEGIERIVTPWDLIMKTAANGDERDIL